MNQKYNNKLTFREKLIFAYISFGFIMLFVHPWITVLLILVAAVVQDTTDQINLEKERKNYEAEHQIKRAEEIDKLRAEMAKIRERF